MKPIRKLLKNNTFRIKDGNHLEEIKDKFFQEHGEDPLWGYDDSYDNDYTVSSGYLHWQKGMFFLSKLHFGKTILNNLNV